MSFFRFRPKYRCRCTWFFGGIFVGNIYKNIIYTCILKNFLNNFTFNFRFTTAATTRLLPCHLTRWTFTTIYHNMLFYFFINLNTIYVFTFGFVTFRLSRCFRLQNLCQSIVNFNLKKCLNFLRVLLPNCWHLN